MKKNNEMDQVGTADIQMENNTIKTEPVMTHMVIPTREFNTLHETSLVNTGAMSLPPTPRTKNQEKEAMSAPGKAGNFLSVKVRHSQRLATGQSQVWLALPEPEAAVWYRKEIIGTWETRAISA
jgi:hypothetical protein